MKSIKLLEDGRTEKGARVRVGCRGIVTDGDKLLLSFGAARDLWMIPGGGLEGDESELECCVREVQEETGYLVRPEACVLEIVDWFAERIMVNRYFPATVIGRAERKLTEQEEKMGMEPKWIPVQEAIAVFSRYDDFAGKNELRRSLYRREYTALCELFGEKQ